MNNRGTDASIFKETYRCLRSNWIKIDDDNTSLGRDGIFKGGKGTNIEGSLEYETRSFELFYKPSWANGIGFGVGSISESEMSLEVLILHLILIT